MEKKRKTRSKSIELLDTARNEQGTSIKDFPETADKRFHIILDSMIEGCQIIGFDWKYLYVNASAARQGRKKKNELLGHTMMEAYPGIENMDMFRKLRLCMTERKSFRIENNFIYPGGSSAWFDLSVQPAKDGIFILSIDITEYKNTEKEIKNLARFPSENPSPVMRAGPGGQLIYANPASSPLMGLWKCAIGGKLPLYLRKIISEAFTANSRPETDVECEGKTYSIQIVPVPDSGLLNLYGKDITERRQMEDELRENEDKFKYIFENSVVGKSITLPTGEIHVNKAFCEMLGYTSGELKKQNWQNITHPDDREMTRRMLDPILSGKKDSTRFLKRYLHKNGSVVWTDISTSMRRDKKGNSLYFMTTVIDITERKRAEEALKTSEYFLNSVIEHTPNPMWISDGEGVIIRINQALRNMLDITDAEIIGKYNVLKDVQVKEQGFLPLVESVFKDSKTVEFEINYNTGKEKQVDLKKTAHRILDIIISPIMDDGGKVINSIAQQMDITERKKVEDALRESEQKFHETIKFLDEGYYSCTPAGILLEHNRAFNRILGFDTALDLKGNKLPDFWQNPDDRKEYMNELITKGGIKNYLINAKKASDEKIVVMASSHMVKDETGRLMRIEGTFTDFTERKLAEEKIHGLNEELEQKVIERTSKLESANEELIKEITGRKRIAETLQMHEAIIANSDDAIYGKDLRGIITSWNKGAEIIYGYSSLETIGQQVSMLLPSDMPDDLHAILSKIANGEHIVHYETKRQRKDSQVIEVSVSISPIRDQSGKITGASTIARDITQRKLAEESINKLNTQLENNVQQLEAANKELEAFSYSVSHDLRAPLRAIDGFSKVLMESNANNIDSEARRYLNIIRTNTQNMGKLIDDLLSFSRIGKQEMHLSLINMESMGRDIFEELKQQNPGRKIEFTLKKTPDASVDAAMMKIVLSNLLGNAVKYTGKRTDAVILFGGSIKNNEVVYCVKDNGVGFDMRYVGKLFGVFQRLHSRDEFEGTGVGLALVQRIIHRHGGRVWAEGKVDEGAMFYFTLPIKKEEINEQ